MTLTSFSFLAFLGIMFASYYMIPKAQKYILLIGSLAFYVLVSKGYEIKASLMIVYVVFITYYSAILIQRTSDGRKKVVLILAISLLGGALILFKYAYNLVEMVADIFRQNPDISWLKLIPFIGMSYFILSAIGYLVDVYWGAYEAEKSIFVVALYIFYFPVVISGPILKFNDMQMQFLKIHKPNYDNITAGLRRMIFGYFKKLVISERLALIVSGAYQNYSGLAGIDLLVATFCYTFQLYTDFSGCMDIIMGASMIFGIELPENFKAPLLSKNLQEFWQRWHITLGKWFKDYVMYPVQISGGMLKLGKSLKKKFGKKVSKRITLFVSMFVLWFTIGLWHGGTACYFVASAGVPFALLILSDLFKPLFEKLTNVLHINTDKLLFKTWQVFRTNLCLLLIWVFVNAGTVSGGFSVMSVFFRRIYMQTLPTLFKVSSLGRKSALMMLLGMAVLIMDDILTYRGSSLKAKVDRLPVAARIILINIEIIILLFAGMVGASGFIYFKF